MTILSIETSCDETAISIIDAHGDFPDATYTIRGDALFSQVETHREYGGVFPSLAKREHALTLVPLLEKVLDDARLQKLPSSALFPEQKEHIQKLLEREPELADQLLTLYTACGKPDIDMIAVTSGPGLEPALWVGVNFARALSYLWDVPVVAVDHMEGHIFSSIFDNDRIPHIAFPALALLISGGHTELVLIQAWGSYKIIGHTVDDAVGEAFDKAARMLELPYPGGPEISKQAEAARKNGVIPSISLPRPMLKSGDHNFSFSGLKTAVLYSLKDKEITPELIQELTLEFENAVTEVLITKTKSAIEEYGIQTLILGGGVSANTHIRDSFKSLIENTYPDIALYLPERKLTTDNAVMIALAGHAQYSLHKEDSYADTKTLRADGGKKLEA